MTQRDDGVVLVGAIMGDVDAERQWGQLIGAFTIEISERTRNVDVPVRLQIELHVPGRHFQPEFTGARSGRYSRRTGTLTIQALADDAVLTRGRSGLGELLVEALDEAESYLAAKRIAGTLDALRQRLADV